MSNLDEKMVKLHRSSRIMLIKSFDKKEAFRSDFKEDFRSDFKEE